LRRRVAAQEGDVGAREGQAGDVGHCRWRVVGEMSRSKESEAR
jgi:hypothetical protein